MKSLFIIFLLVLSSIVSAQTKITWEDLKCEFEEVWSEEHGAIYLMPNFDANQLKLDSTLVIVTGKLYSYSIEEEFYILSKEAIDLGFHGSYGGPNELIEIEFLNKPNTTKTNKKIKVQGLLTLNKTDELHLFYILKNAKIIK